MKYYRNILTKKIGKDLFLAETEDGKYLVDNVTAAIAVLNPNIDFNDTEHIELLKQRIDMDRQYKRVFSPTEYIKNKKLCRLMLFLTNSCNLRCIYCHCNSSIGDDMSDRTIDTAVSKYCDHIENRLASIYKYEETPQITFMGGGEPFLRIKKIKEIVTYFKNRCSDWKINPRFVIVTNTTLGDDEDWKWLVDQGFLINLSLDGPQDVQNRNRPMFGGYPTSSVIEARLAYLSSIGAECHVRSTVISVDEVDDICHYFERFDCVKTHALEPVSVAGRAEKGLISSQDEFYKHFFDKYSSYLLENPSRYKSSWFKPFKRTEGFCGAVYCNAIVHPNGNVSLCSEVGENETNSFLKEKFFVSSVYDEGLVYESPKAVLFSEEHFLDNLPRCRDCIIKYKCGGGCYIKRYRDFGGDADKMWDVFCKCAINLNLSYLLGCMDQK